MASSENEIELTPPDVVKAASITCLNLIPEMSKTKYSVKMF